MKHNLTFRAFLLLCLSLTACDPKIKEYDRRKARNPWYCTTCIPKTSPAMQHGDVHGHPPLNGHSHVPAQISSWVWSLPKEWREIPDDTRLARYELSGPNGTCDCFVRIFPSHDTGVDEIVHDIIAIWRGQMNLPPLKEEDIGKQDKEMWITGELLIAVSPLLAWKRGAWRALPELRPFKRETLLQKMRDLFAAHGHALSPNAAVKAGDSKGTWIVSDNDRQYSLMIDGKKLEVYAGVRAVFNDMSGAYRGMQMKEPRDNYRMLGVIGITEYGLLLIQLVGPVAAVEENYQDFLLFCRSFRLVPKK